MKLFGLTLMVGIMFMVRVMVMVLVRVSDPLTEMGLTGQRVTHVWSS